MAGQMGLLDPLGSMLFPFQAMNKNDKRKESMDVFIPDRIIPNLPDTGESTYIETHYGEHTPDTSEKKQITKTDTVQEVTYNGVEPEVTYNEIESEPEVTYNEIEPEPEYTEISTGVKNLKPINEPDVIYDELEPPHSNASIHCKPYFLVEPD